MYFLSVSAVKASTGFILRVTRMSLSDDFFNELMYFKYTLCYNGDVVS